MLDKNHDRNPFLNEKINKHVLIFTHQTYNFTAKIHCLGDYTSVFQLDLDNDNSWYNFLPGLMPFIKHLMIKANELGQITHILNSDTRRARMYNPKLRQNFFDKINYHSVSDFVLKKTKKFFWHKAKCFEFLNLET